MSTPSVTVADRGNGSVVVEIAGEVDLGGTRLVAGVIAAVVHGPGVRRVTVDLAGVRFLDVPGTNVLVAARTEADVHGVRLTIANPNKTIGKLLELTGVLTWLSGCRCGEETT